MGDYKEGYTRRDLMKFGAASAAAGVAGSLSLAGSAATAAEPAARHKTRFVLDCHIHVGGSPGLAAMIDQVRSPKDYLALRGRRAAIRQFERPARNNGQSCRHPRTHPAHTRQERHQ